MTLSLLISSISPQDVDFSVLLIKSPSTTRSPIFTVGLPFEAIVILSSSLSTINLLIGSSSIAVGNWAIPSSLHKICVVAITSPALTIVWFLTCNSVWVEPWLESEIVSRLTKIDSSMTRFNLLVSLSFLSGIISTSTVIWGVASKVSKLNWVLSNSTPSTDFINSPSLKVNLWIAFKPKWGPLSCFTCSRSGNWASSGIVNSSTVLNKSPLHFGVSSLCTKRISSFWIPSIIFSPGLTSIPSSSKRFKTSSSSHSWNVPFLTVISRKISFFWVTVTIPEVWLNISLTTSVPASIHCISSIIRREISLLISWVSWGIHNNVPPWLTSNPFFADLAFLTLSPGAYFTSPPVFVLNLSSARSAMISPLLILLPGTVLRR